VRRRREGGSKEASQGRKKCKGEVRGEGERDLISSQARKAVEVLMRFGMDQMP